MLLHRAIENHFLLMQKIWEGRNINSGREDKFTKELLCIYIWMVLIVDEKVLYKIDK